MNDMNKIMFLVGNKDYHIWAYQNAHKELGLPNVLVHGDLWNSNKNGSDNKILALVDWQLVYEGSSAADLVRYIVRGTEASVRRKTEPTFFSFYIKCICDLIPNLEIYESQIRKAYIYSFISEFVELLVITVNNAKSLQHSINNDENVQVNLNLKQKIICRTISAMEDISKFIDSGEFEDVVKRF
uniref:CHK kinase-like domain-containing protein n=1 Tax=Panagrolaimus davidi TaxID=227884 RepID=A0A914QG70_9BILA